MSTTPAHEGRLTSSRRASDPIDRLSEVLFGLIMVFTFTGSLSVAEAGRDDERARHHGDRVAGPAPGAGEKAWDFYASAYTYILPDSQEYVQPTLAADRGWLHLEGRFNYEALDTGSARWFSGRRPIKRSSTSSAGCSWACPTSART